MAVKEKKQAIIDWVNQTTNSDYLEAIYDAISFEDTSQDILEALTPEKREKIDAGLDDIENGRTTSHDEVKARYGL